MGEPSAKPLEPAAPVSGGGTWERWICAVYRRLSGLAAARWHLAERLIVDGGCFSRKRLLPIMGLSVLTVALELAGVFSLLPMLQLVEAGQDVAKLTAESKGWRVAADAAGAIGVPINMWSLGAATVLLIAGRQAVFFLSNYKAAVVREKFAAYLRLSTMRKLMEATPATIASIGAGPFITVVNSQVTPASSAVVNFLQLLVSALSFLAYAIGVAFISPGIILVGLGAGAITFFVLQRFVRTSYDINRKQVQRVEGFGRLLTQSFQAWRLVKLTSRLDPVLEKLDRASGLVQANNIALARNSGLVQLIAVPLATTLALLALAVATSVFALSIAQLTLLLVVLFRLGPMAEAFAKLRQGQAGVLSAIERLSEMQSLCAANREVDRGTRAFAPPRHAIRFRNVSFRHAGRTERALDGVDLEIPAGLVTAIIGPSGAGKSTLLDLLPRLAEPDEGVVSIDNTPLGEFRLAELRRGIAVVDQHPILFDGTVAENMRFAAPDATEADLRAALAKAAASEFYESFPAGLETAVGDNGAGLSGGQRQRLTIARAFLAGARLIIMDEPTSALDFEAETVFRRAVQDLRRGGQHTIVVVAHRVSTIQDADFVVAMRDGRVEEAAAPSKLRGDATYYSRLIASEAAVEVAPGSAVPRPVARQSEESIRT